MSKAWEQELASHPDQQFAAYMLNGIKHGFRVSYDYSHNLSSSAGYMASAVDHPEAVSDCLQQEKLLNRMVFIPGLERPANQCHSSPWGMIPKKSNPGKRRLIADLSSPHNTSVNDGTDKEMCRVSYNAIVDCILQYGKGTLMAKADIKQAYRISKHTEDRCLLAMQWQGQVLVVKALPFGLRPAPLIFISLADALQWIMEKRGVKNVYHYLDDLAPLVPYNASKV